jgi:hypothetical protein
MRRADNLTTFICVDCLEIWEPQPPQGPQDLWRPVMGLLYLLQPYNVTKCTHWNWLTLHCDNGRTQCSDSGRGFWALSNSSKTLAAKLLSLLECRSFHSDRSRMASWRLRYGSGEKLRPLREIRTLREATLYPCLRNKLQVSRRKQFLVIWDTFPLRFPAISRCFPSSAVRIQTCDLPQSELQCRKANCWHSECARL